MNEKEFFDEKIIEMMNQVEQPTVPMDNHDAEEVKPEERTIYTGLRIKGEWVYFEPRLFFDEQLSMMIPTTFTNMPLEMAKIKYPSQQRPEIILTDDTTAINLMMTHMSEAMKNEESEAVRDQIMGMMQRLNPGIKTWESGVEVVSDKNVAYVAFSNPVMDGKLYNLMYFLELNGRTLMVSFNCKATEMKYWKKAAFEMMQSMKLVEVNADEPSTE